MEKKYVECANKVRAAVTAYEIRSKEYHEAISELQRNPRYSNIGRKELTEEISKEIKKLSEEAFSAVCDAVKEFCKEYRITIKDDGKDHQTDIANALKVVEMCGAGLTVDLLRSVLEPMRGSYKALKIVKDVLEVRFNRDTEKGIRYLPEIREVIYDYIGKNTDIEAFNERFNGVADIVNAEPTRLFGTSLVEVTDDENTVWEVNSRVSYSMYALADEMLAVGVLYEEMAEKYPLIFTAYIPTNKEVVESHIQ